MHAYQMVVCTYEMKREQVKMLHNILHLISADHLSVSSFTDVNTALVCSVENKTWNFYSNIVHRKNV